MEVRTFVYHLTFKEMEKYMTNKGYIVKSAIKILKEDLSIDKDMIEKFMSGYSRKILYNKFAYLIEERQKFLTEFLNNVKDRLNVDKRNLFRFDKGKYSWKTSWQQPNPNNDVYKYLLDVRTMELIKNDFKTFILNKNE